MRKPKLIPELGELPELFGQEAFLPRITAVGRQRLLLENHRGIQEFSPLRIVLRLRGGSLSVWGEGLKIQAMNQSQLLITGNLSRLEWEDSNEKHI